MKLLQNFQLQIQNSKTTDAILMCLEILLHKHKAVIKVPEAVKQTVNRRQPLRKLACYR